MKTMPVVCISLTIMLLLTMTSAAQDPAGALVETVRQATAQFQNVEEATKAGYVDPLVCVSGPEEGAMGVHFGNAELINDGVLDPERPELLVYEPKEGQFRLDRGTRGRPLTVRWPSTRGRDLRTVGPMW